MQVKTLTLIRLACSVEVSRTYSKTRASAFVYTDPTYCFVLLTAYCCQVLNAPPHYPRSLLFVGSRLLRLLELNRALALVPTACFSYARVLAPEGLLGLLIGSIAACGTAVLFPLAWLFRGISVAVLGLLRISSMPIR